MVVALVGKLSPEFDYEANLNATQILTEAIEETRFFRILNTKPVVERLCEFAFPDVCDEGNASSRVGATSVLFNMFQWFNEKHQKGPQTEGEARDEDDDVRMQDEDDSEPNENPSVDEIRTIMPRLVSKLQKDTSLVD